MTSFLNKLHVGRQAVTGGGMSGTTPPAQTCGSRCGCAKTARKCGAWKVVKALNPSRSLEEEEEKEEEDLPWMLTWRPPTKF